jgi:hypothetical protein
MEQDIATVNVDLQGPDAERSLPSLMEWVRGEHIPGLRVEHPPPKTEGGHMGSGLGTTLHAIFQSLEKTVGPIKTLVQTVYGWLQANRSDLTVTMKGKDWEVTLDGKKLPDLEPLLDRVESLVNLAKSK